MYDPVKDGVAKTTERVVYREARPPAELRDLVHCFWELRTEAELAADFTLHAMPDACVNLLFDQPGPGSRSAITASSRSSPTPKAT